MIESIRHKGLLKFYTEGNGSKLPSQYLRKINRILDILDSISCVEDILAIGSGVHKLKGGLSKFWSVSVTPNYRIIFQFDGQNIQDVDFLDYD